MRSRISARHTSLIPESTKLQICISKVPDDKLIVSNIESIVKLTQQAIIQ